MNLLVASILPIIILIIFFYSKDKFEKEPIQSLMKAFTGGILSTFLSLIIVYSFGFKIPFFNSFVYVSFVEAFVQAAIPEELSKFILLYLFIWNDKNFNEYYDGILYSIFVALGFAALENFLYVMEGGYGVAFSRALLAVPLHTLCGVIMGYYFSIAKFTRKKVINIIKAVGGAIIAHGVYDFILFYANKFIEITPGVAVISTLLVFALVIYLWKSGLKKINKHIAKSIFKDNDPTDLII